MTVDFATMLLAILPELGLVVLIVVVLGLDLLWRDKRVCRLGWLTATGCLFLAVLSLVFAFPPAEPLLIWGGMLRFDVVGFVFRILFLLGAALTALFSLGQDDLQEHGEYYGLMLVSTLGMSLMASATDLIMLYLAIETTSIPLYVLAGFRFRDDKSVEAGIKYLLFGAMTSAVMLYGFSWLYGLSGTTQIAELAEQIERHNVPLPLLAASLVLVLVGFGFKISAVPFHFWSPDVYEGAPTPIAGYLSTASKAAGFAVLMRVLLSGFWEATLLWMDLTAGLAIISMTIGNLLALAQTNIKRLLAYSSIAQAGYILVGVAAGTSFGMSSAVYYLMAYLLTNLAAFGVASVVGKRVGSDELSAYAGLSRRAPAMALILLISMLSLGGIPPFAGFVGKVLVFAAAVEAGRWWLALIGVINSMIALYYYLVVLKKAYLLRSEDEQQPLQLIAGWRVALLVCVAGMLALGVVIAPWFDWAGRVGWALTIY
jgi:NADH-quinone oxidoreductase subunit N